MSEDAKEQAHHRPKPTPEDGMVALEAHVRDRAELARQRYGTRFDAQTLKRLLEDRSVVRYPCEVVFDTTPLRAGEPALVRPRGDTAAEGFDMVVHPRYAADGDAVAALVLYQLVAVNYGDIATHREAGLFGATVLGLDVEGYYDRLCALADALDS